MERKDKIEKLIEETLESASHIETVEVPSLFKEKVLNSMATPEEITEEAGIISWFTPRYQVAALICFVIVNAYAVLQYTLDNYEDNVESFAEEYGLSEAEEDYGYTIN
ncbi:MAG: hypothetical protein AB3N14_05710 [Flavobacteriaceae bacterium]